MRGKKEKIDERIPPNNQQHTFDQSQYIFDWTLNLEMPTP